MSLLDALPADIKDLIFLCMDSPNVEKFINLTTKNRERYTDNKFTLLHRIRIGPYVDDGSFEPVLKNYILMLSWFEQVIQLLYGGYFNEEVRDILQYFYFFKL